MCGAENESFERKKGLHATRLHDTELHTLALTKPPKGVIVSLWRVLTSEMLTFTYVLSR